MFVCLFYNAECKNELRKLPCGHWLTEEYTYIVYCNCCLCNCCLFSNKYVGYVNLSFIWQNLRTHYYCIQLVNVIEEEGEAAFIDCSIRQSVTYLIIRQKIWNWMLRSRSEISPWAQLQCWRFTTPPTPNKHHCS